MPHVTTNQVFSPIAKLLFPRAGAGFFDHHHTFVVQYEPGKDLGLDMHTDSSHVTFNACLGKEFTGAPLVFCGMQVSERLGLAGGRLHGLFGHAPHTCTCTTARTNTNILDMRRLLFALLHTCTCVPRARPRVFVGWVSSLSRGGRATLRIGSSR